MVYLLKQIQNLNKFSVLPSDEQKLLFQAILGLPLVHLGLNLLGYSRLYSLIKKLISLKNGRIIPADQVIHRGRDISRIVSLAGRHGFIKPGCLRRSVLIWCLLRREGISSEIRFGVRIETQTLEAHAWVEYQRENLSDEENEHEQFRVLQNAIPSASSGL